MFGRIEYLWRFIEVEQEVVVCLEGGVVWGMRYIIYTVEKASWKKGQGGVVRKRLYGSAI